MKTKKGKQSVAVIGLGYVGLPLSLAICQAGFFVYGIDTDTKKIQNLKNNKSYIDDVSDSELSRAIRTQKFFPSKDFSKCAKADVVIIAVPTPLTIYQTPDISYIKSATQRIAEHLQKDQLIILESTTYPKTTREILKPMLDKKKVPYFLAFSPERVDPGNKVFTIINTPKVIGGIDETSTKKAVAFYQQVVQKVVSVSSAEVAEMTKLFENIFRIVNISLVNEMALLSDKMSIDIWEVIKAASTKPYGFMPFYPGPGVGGHCIAVDPFYLSYKAKEYGFFTRFIDLAGEINSLMPHFVVTKIATALNYARAKSINKSSLLLIGIAYKKDIQDTRESSAIPIAKALIKKGAHVQFYDPFIRTWNIGDTVVPRIKKLTASSLRAADCVVIITNHSNIDYPYIAKHSAAIVDTRNAMEGIAHKHLYRL